MNKDKLERMPSNARKLNFREPVRAGDYLHIYKYYHRIRENDWMIPYYTADPDSVWAEYWRIEKEEET